MKLSFRQVHLDFHTSECIDGIGSNFSKEQFQEMLKVGHVSSITVFSKCHHGWAYHPSEANKMHPGLKFDLLGAQIEAAHEIGVKTPVYISAGHDERIVYEHPEWQMVGKTGQHNPLHPSYHGICLNTPYLDFLLAQIKEVCERYDADGIFLDIVGERMCYCPTCIKTMLDRGWDPEDDNNVRKLGQEIYANYTRRVRETIDSVKPGLPVFHNGGHIICGRRDLAKMNTHLELESLPTSGWGYDHFPMSVAYTRNLGMEIMGMTGKFHTSWGEFGGFKHKNALRYEAALSIANGAKCSVGDQLHPTGLMNDATYKLIGAAYAEVEQKEAWCDEVTAVTDVGLISIEAFDGNRRNPSNIGAARMLLEGKYLFDILDLECDFSKYKVIVLPDAVPLTEKLREKLDAYVAAGGQLLASGDSGIDLEKGEMAYDLGCVYEGHSAYCPAYVIPGLKLKSLEPTSYLVYGEGNRVQRVGDGQELAQREEPYFNRSIMHFCSHRNTPNNGEVEGSAITVGKHGAYICWKLFSEYATVGDLITKEIFHAVLDLLLGDRKTLQTNLPSQARVTLMDQTAERRLVNHLLFASLIKRGDGSIEVIEDVIPLYDVQVTVRPGRTIRRVYLAPQMEEIPFTQENGQVRYTVKKLENHQMVVMDY